MPALAAIHVTQDLLHALQQAILRPPRWMVASEVQVPSPCGEHKRFLDAMAMDLGSGQELHGFELKVSRNDWQNELRKPNKWLGAAECVDRFWLVAGCNNVYRDAEVPAQWGIIAPNGDGELEIIRQASRLAPRQQPPAPWPRHAITAFLARHSTQGLHTHFAQKLERDAEARGYRRGVQETKRRSTSTTRPAAPKVTRAVETRPKYNPGRYNFDDGEPLDLP